jgi:hypothetical protein
MRMPVLKQQEIPFDHPESSHMFQPSAEKPLVATPAAVAAYQRETIIACLAVLQEHAVRHGGLDYLQVFDDPDRPEALWFIDDDVAEAITALLPSDY